MQIFREKKKGALSPVERQSFALEKDIQALVEANLEALFGLELVSSEFAVGSFRLDSLAFDAQSNAFVIVEYKRSSNYSVVDQGYAFLSTMLNSKADFVLEYNESTGKALKRADVDWSASRVKFISPSFTTYQKKSVDFRDVPFELWEIKRFEGGLVALEQLQAASTESIEGLGATGDKKSVIATVSDTVKVLNEDDHAAKLSESLRSVWQTLREKLQAVEGTEISANNSYVSWKRDGTAIAFFRMSKKSIRVDILRGNVKAGGETSKGFFTLDDPKELAVERSWTWKSGVEGHAYVFNVRKAEDLKYLLFLLDQKQSTLG